MPYRSLKKKRWYQRRWMAGLRLEWLMAHGPCQSPNHDLRKSRYHLGLEIHHCEPAKKWRHRIFSYSKQKHEKELRGTIVLCYECHQRLSREECRRRARLRRARTKRNHVAHGTK